MNVFDSPIILVVMSFSLYFLKIFHFYISDDIGIFFVKNTLFNNLMKIVSRDFHDKTGTFNVNAYITCARKNKKKRPRKSRDARWKLVKN